ncbi:hypothetical protein Tco_1220338 [Tanacetum coccineum]
MPTEMELTLEQTQQGVSYEVSSPTQDPCDFARTQLESKNGAILYESNLFQVMDQRFNTTAGNPVKKILLKLNLSDHRKLKEGGEDFRYSDIARLSQSDEVLKLKNFKKDATLKLSKSSN